MILVNWVLDNLDCYLLPRVLDDKKGTARTSHTLKLIEKVRAQVNCEDWHLCSKGVGFVFDRIRS